jgi:hypothetical protein
VNSHPSGLHELGKFLMDTSARHRSAALGGSSFCRFAPL